MCEILIYRYDGIEVDIFRISPITSRLVKERKYSIMYVMDWRITSHFLHEQNVQYRDQTCFSVH